MKRLLVVATSVLCLVAFFFACSDLQNLSEPKKVVVKPGDAKYSIPFGGYSVAFDDYINVTKLQENLAGGDDEDSADTKLRLSVYDYQDPMEKNVQKYIIEYPIASISLLEGITDFLQNSELPDDGDDSQISISIKSDPFQGSVETGLSIGSLLDNLIDSGDNGVLADFVNELKNKIGVQGVEGYLYVTAPMIEGGAIDFADPSPLTGYVVASYVLNDFDSEESKSEIDILIGNGTKDDPEKIELEIKNNVPSFASLADENSLISEDIMFSEGYNYYSEKTKEGVLTSIINQKADDLRFAYDISFEGNIYLNKNQINALKSAANAEIVISIAVVLPLKLDLTDDIVVDNIMALAGDGEDVDFLGDEDSDSDFSEYTDYTESLKSLDLWYQFQNPLGLSIDAVFSEKNIPEKEMRFDNGKHSIPLEQKEIDKILTESSFIPRISMTLKKGEFSVTRNAELKMNVALGIETDNDADIEFEL